jgi:hypothetical protein
LKQNLADRLEARVGDEATFLTKIEANKPQFFLKFESSGFD